MEAKIREEMATETNSRPPDHSPTMILAPWVGHSFWHPFGLSTLGTTCCSSGKSVKLTELREIG